MSRVADLISAFLMARAGGPLVPDLAGDGLTASEAYRVQTGVASALGPVGGWKVACKPGADQILAPIFATDMHSSGSNVTVPKGVRVGIELEIGFRVVRPLPPLISPDFEAAARNAIELVPVFEVIHSRLENPAGAAPLLKLADNQINGGMVVGDAIADWSGIDMTGAEIDLCVHGETVAEGRKSVPGGGAFDNFCTLTRIIGPHVGGLQVGQVVITGSLNGLHWTDAPVSAKGHIHGVGTVETSLSPA